MQSKEINPVIRWWVTPKLPAEDVFAKHNFLTQWVVHPVKRRLAKSYLELLKKFTGITVIGVTGSAGKSTTTQMLATILKKGGSTFATPASIDPVYNIPNTILKVKPGTKYLILEMSVEYPGEMDYYLWLARPDIGIVTNIYPTHTLYFGDETGVAKEKSKLIKSLPSSGLAVLNGGNRYTKGMASLTKAKVVYFNDVGDPISQNSSAAIAAAEHLGVNPKVAKEALLTHEHPDHRFKVIKHKSGALIFDDTYNSNPEAFIATLKTFISQTGKMDKVAVVGDMLELGKLEESGHRKVGKKLRELNFKAVVGVGKSVKYTLSELDKNKTRVEIAEKYNDAIPLLKPYLRKNTAIFVKGSRSIRLDKLIADLF